MTELHCYLTFSTIYLHMQVSPQDVDNAVEVESQGAALTIGELINVTWNPLSVFDNNLFKIDTPKVDISLLRYKKNEKKWEETAVLATDLPNNGHASVRLPDIQPLDESQSLDLTLIRVAPNTSTTISQSPRIKRSLSSRWKALKKFSKLLAMVFEKSSIEKRLCCEEWHRADRGVDVMSIPPCPCNTSQAKDDSRYVQETDFIANILRKKVFHPHAERCYRQTTAR